MKNIIIVILVAVSFALAVPAFAVPETEKSFIDAYKKAYESKDEATMKSFLYSKGADPEALEFFTMMLTGDLGGKISSIELRDLNADEIKKAAESMPMPNGGMSKLPVTPSKKLVLKVSHADANGTSTSSSESFVALVDGKYMIPVPVPVK